MITETTSRPSSTKCITTVLGLCHVCRKLVHGTCGGTVFMLIVLSLYCLEKQGNQVVAHRTEGFMSVCKVNYSTNISGSMIYKSVSIEDKAKNVMHSCQT